MSYRTPFLISPLYDVSASYAVDKLFAERITDFALNIFTPYAHLEMAAEDPRPITFPEYLDELSPQLLRDTIIKSRLRVLHPILYTKRPIDNSDLCIKDVRERRERQIEIRGINRIFDISDFYVKDVTILKVDHHLGRNDESSYVGWALHELGHNFGLMHCTSKCCVMQPRLASEQISEFANEHKNTIFCREHSRKLDQTM